jgi:hypothetical protein
MSLPGMDTPDSSALSTSPPDLSSLVQQAAEHQQVRDQGNTDTFGGLVEQAAHWQQKRDLLSPAERQSIGSNPMNIALQAEYKAAEQARGTPLNDNEKFAIQDAFNRSLGSVSHIQPFESIQQQVSQATSKDNTFLQNVGQPLAEGASSLVTGAIGITNPEYAAYLQRRMKDTYATPEEGSAGAIAGKIGGIGIQTAGIIGAGPAAPLLMGAEGVGNARTEVAQQRFNGQEISGLQEGTYAAINGLINYAAGNVLQKVGGNAALPFPKIVASLPANIRNAITGSDGKVLIPFIAQTLAKMGVGAGDNEIANIATNAAASLTGVDKQRGLLDNSLEALVTGAGIAGGTHAVATVRNPSEHIGAPIHGESGTVAGEPVFNTGTNRYESLPGEAVKNPGGVPSAAPALSDSSAHFDGHQMPHEQIDISPEALQRRIQESEELIQRVNGASKNLRPPGTMENHPLVEKLKQFDPTAKVVEVPKEHQELFDDIVKATGRNIIPITSDVAQGFANPEHPDAVLIDVKNPKKSVWNVVAHEVAHTFQYESPEMFKQVRDRLPQWFKNESETTYKKMLKKQGWSDDAINEYWKNSGDQEIVSMAFGESAATSRMLQRQFRGGDEGLWNSLRTSVEKVLNKFTSRGRIINEISSALRDSVGSKGVPTEETRKGSERVREEARAYSESKGLKYQDISNLPLNEERAKKVADVYSEAKHEPNNPEVKASYEAFRNETADQLKFLEDRGVKFEPWTKEGQPYKNSSDMIADVDKNKHLYFYTGGDMPADHPLAEKIPGRNISYNDAFRAVHDYFGHSREGFQFGPRGEDNAYRAHSAMYSEAARPAMAAETRGQNSFVNFGPNGEYNRANPKDTKFADQKATVLPTDLLLPKKTYLGIGHRFRGDGSETLWWRDDDGQFQEAEVTAAKGTHVQHGAGEAQFRGRIDHTLKEISVVASAEVQSADPQNRQVAHVGKQLAKKYPGYDVFVSTRGGLTPVEELAGGGHLYPTLERVKEIKEDQPLGEKAKEIYNAATPKNGWKFAQAVGDTLRKGLSDSLADFVDEARVLAKNIPVTKVPLEAYIRLHAGIKERIAKQRETGLRSLFGDVYTDPNTNETLTRDWQLKPVKDAVERMGNASKKERRKEAFDFTSFATRVGVAESTIERGGNRVKIETSIAAEEKIKKLFDSLPAGTEIKQKLNTIMDEGAEPSEYVPLKEQEEESNAQKELNKTRKKIKDLKQLIADFQKLGKSEDVTKQPGEAKGGRGTPPPSELLTKAQEKLAVWEKVLDHVQNGKNLEPNDVLTKDEILAIQKKALSRPLTGIAGEDANGFKDLETAKGFIEQAKGEKNYDLSQEFLRRYRLMGTAHLDVLVQSGRLSNDAATKIRKSNEFYTDLHRVMEKTGAIDPGQTPGSGLLHKFRGSNREIDNPYINQQMTTERSYEVAEKNYILKEFIAQAKEHGTTKPELAEKAGPDTIDVYENGERKTYKVDQEVAEAINGWGKHITSDGVRLIGKVLGTPGRTWMFLTQKNPFYHVNNVIKDMRSRAILSKESGGINTVTQEVKGLDPETRELVSVLGGTFGGRGELANTRAAYEKITRKALNDIGGDPNAILALPGKVWKGINHFAEMSESVGRTAEYTAQFDAAKKRGMSDQDARTYAAWKARDLMDFAVSGTWIKAINEISYVPVLNSQFRGLAKHLEMLKSDPKLYAKRMTLFGLMPALIPAIWAKAQGDDQWKKYKSIPLVQRIMFDNYMLGDVRVVIPRGEMTASASMMHELLFQNHFDPNDIFRAFAATQLPGAVENPESLIPLKGVREAYSNYSWFYNRNIIPPSEEGVALDLRNTDSASPLSKAISLMAEKAGMELDPRKIDHVIRTDFGTLGGVVESASRLGESKGVSTATKASMMGGYVRTTPGYTDQEVQRVMKTAERLKDSSSPAVQSMQASLKASYDAPTLAERNKLVDDARRAADAANAFYDQYGDTLLVVRKLGASLNQAKAEYEANKTFADRQVWLKANPDKVPLIREDGSYDKVMSRINELRKLSVKPDVSDTTRKMADREIDRLFKILVKMSGKP